MRIAIWRPGGASGSRLFFSLLLAVVLLAAVGSATKATTLAKRGDVVRVTADQTHQIGVAEVETRRFRVRKIAIGQIGYDEDSTTVLVSPFSGRVVRLIARLGETVAKGDPLVELDSADVLPPQNDFVAATGALNKARTQLDLARIAESRSRGLYESKAGALKDWQQAQVQLVAAENDLRSAETALDAAQRRLKIIGRTDADIEALAAHGTTSRSVIIPAPIAGTVIARKVSVGQYVRAELSEPLCSISDLSTMWLKAMVPENDLGAIRVGDTLDIAVSALSNRTYSAKVEVIGALSDAITHRVVVRSEIPNPDGALKAEMFATIRIETGAGRTAPAVPIEAVIREGDRAVVWVEQEPSMFQRRPVTLGMEQDGRFEIRAGLMGGERIVTSGAIFIENEWQQ